MSSWIWLLLICALLALVFVLRPSDTRQTDVGTPRPAHEPDLYMQGAIIKQFRDDGSLRYVLSSERIRHFADMDLTRLDQPVLEMREGQQPAWSARAVEGELHVEDDAQRQEVIRLRDQVFLEQTRGERFVSLSSDELTVYPDRQFAETERPVMIDSNAGRTKAVGLAADLRRSVLDLSSSETQRVHTIVLPDQFKPEPSP